MSESPLRLTCQAGVAGGELTTSDLDIDFEAGCSGVRRIVMKLSSHISRRIARVAALTSRDHNLERNVKYSFIEIHLCFHKIRRARNKNDTIFQLLLSIQDPDSVLNNSSPPPKCSSNAPFHPHQPHPQFQAPSPAHVSEESSPQQVYQDRRMNSR